MACRISKEYKLSQGKEEYLMLTADFGSLQMRLTTQDTTLNKSTHGKCDPGLYEEFGTVGVLISIVNCLACVQVPSLLLLSIAASL